MTKHGKGGGGLMGEFDFDEEDDWSVEVRTEEERIRGFARRDEPDDRSPSAARRHDESIESTKPPPSQIAREGWLRVLQGNNWIRYYAVATYKEHNKGVLHLYKDDHEMSAARVVDLSACHEIEPSELSAGYYEFKLAPQDIHLATDSGTERSQWITALRMMLHRDRSRQNSSSTSLLSKAAEEYVYPYATETGNTSSTKQTWLSPTSTPPAATSQAGWMDVQAEIGSLKEIVLKVLEEDSGSQSSELGKIEDLLKALVKEVETFKESKAASREDVTHQFQKITSSLTELATETQRVHNLLATCGAADVHGLAHRIHATQQQQNTDMGMLMGMVAESSQKSNSKSDEVMKGVKSIRGDIEIVRSRIGEVWDKVDGLGQAVHPNSNGDISAIIEDLKSAVVEGGRVDDVVRSVAQMQDELQGKIAKSENTTISVGRNIQKSLESLKSTQAQSDAGIQKALVHLNEIVTNLNEQAVAKPSLEPILTQLHEIQARLSGPTNPAFSNTRLDRPTTNMITSINDKLIHVTRLIDHIQETQTSRFSALESGLKESVAPKETTVSQADATSTDQILQQYKLTDIRDTLQSLEDRLSRVGREGQTRHEIMDGRLDRVMDQLKHMQRAVTKLVQVELLEANVERPQSGPDQSLMNEQRNILSKIRKDISDIKEHMTDDVTLDRVNDLLSMLGISQDTHAAMAERINVIAGNIQKVENMCVDTTEIKERLAPISEINKRLDSLSDAVASLTSKPSLVDAAASPSSLSTLTRLTESIHSCLVSYLPIDLDTRLTSIQAAIQNSHRSSQTLTHQYPAPPLSQSHRSSSSLSQADLTSLLSDVSDTKHTTREALDSIQHSLARVMDCLEMHGLTKRVAKASVVEVEAVAPVVDSTAYEKLTSQIINLTLLRQSLTAEIEGLLSQKTALMSQLHDIEHHGDKVMGKSVSLGKRIPLSGGLVGAKVIENRRTSCPSRTWGAVAGSRDS
ncbi:hypothetical protein HDU85_000753 [Gaertneriomyces sp. JEL0708]|nr:hypothetical protein HDU85_000753 [Gaertneriomyces sp. JEL0708]